MSIHRNTAYNIAGSVIPLALSLVTVPIYLKLIGESRYGVLAIAWLLLGYFGLFDLGLGRATAQHIAALSHAETKERSETFWTALSLNAGLGFFGGLLIWPIATYFFSNIFKIEDALHPEMIASIPWLILAVPMATLSGVLTGALQGREQFLELNIISITSTVIFQIFPLLISSLFGPELYFLLPAALSARLITLIVLIWRCSKHVFDKYRPCFIRAKALHLLSFGGWVTVSSLITPMMVTLDRFVIGAISGAKTVTLYTIPFQLSQRITLLPGALSTALFPRMASTNNLEARKLACQGVNSLIAVMTPLVLLGLFIMEPFLKFWVGEDFSNKSALVGQLLLIGFWANSFAWIPYTQLQACGRPDLVAKSHLSEVLPYFALLFLGLKYYGLVGAAIAFSIRVFLDLLILSWLSGILSLILRLIFLPSIFLTIGLLTTLFKMHNYIYGLLLLGIQLFIAIIWSWKKAPKELKSLIINRANIFLYFGNKLEKHN